jgi:sulfite reductase beta subunit-like hemoprotein
VANLTEADMDRYARAAHAIQTGVSYEQAIDPSDGSPKQLRTGINLRATDHQGLVRLLMSKGIISEAEYIRAMADAAEEEVRRYEQRLNERMGGPTKITLA